MGISLLTLAVASSLAAAAPVDPAVRAALDSNGMADVLIAFPESAPSLAPLAPDTDYKLRRRALVAALMAKAHVDQAATRAWLDARHIAYRSYWVANVIQATVSPANLDDLANRNDVRRIVANTHISAQLPVPQATTSSPVEPRGGIAWGVQQIGAPQVWTLGYTGQGVVIAGEDTGYQWDHPALKQQYRGWNGVMASHDYNWHDSIHDSIGNQCGNDVAYPCDDYGHGTHTAGTFAGDTHAGQHIGVAPGARWIGCRNMDDGDGTPARYIECMQWLLAPTDLANQNPDPDFAPDVASNSWGCTPSEGCTAGDEIEAAVDNVVAGGIFYVAAAGNDGAGCSTILNPPATYASSFVVGATDSDDALASFSSRGPVVGNTLIKPDLSAPGVNVYSSIPGDGYSYMSGTSMATPHVAGAAALLLSVAPQLKGDPTEIASILRATAVTDGVTNPYHESCGGVADGAWPNYTIGYGRLDVHAAALMALDLFGELPIFADGFDGIATP